MTEGDFIKNVLQNIYENLYIYIYIYYYSMQPPCFFRASAPV